MIIKRIGFGQVEPNHLSAKRTGQIYAQLPVEDGLDVLENGQFVKYNYSAEKVSLEGAGEYMLVFNEVKLYDERDTYKDFAMIRTDYMNGEMVPRLFKTNIGDIFTTNCIEKANSKGVEYAGVDLVVGDILKVNAQGYLSKEGTSEMEWEVVKVYNMPDMQPAVKIMRVK